LQLLAKSGGGQMAERKTSPDPGRFGFHLFATPLSSFAESTPIWVGQRNTTTDGDPFADNGGQVFAKFGQFD
jgi:hypothetical protein